MIIRRALRAEIEQKGGMFLLLMKPKIMSWNVRGINEVNKRLYIKSLLRSWKVDIVCLQETKLEVISLRIIRSLWSCLQVGWHYLPSIGASRGILVMWDKRVVENKENFMGDYVVACSFMNVIDGYQWAFAGVYGPNLDRSRSLLWDELAGISSFWDLPWCIGGDFNVTRFPSERSGGVGYNQPMVDFSNFISEQNLQDIPLAGGSFTWSNNRDLPS
ncbi:hypothetical protein F2P56_005379 [Juglans regia]|uniref:Endonuclease/exonuclease/phosphatase domain-containing protein n=1 Tax=Juglans regia TaxID=51240 RepID=A0A834D711_JUGRE|nr:hypothetical protein F2P56_005379 [Juglans regia]